MFWRFPNATPSTVDALLDKDPPCTLQELLLDNDLLQECKNKNERLIARLATPETAKRLIEHVVRPEIDGADDAAERLARSSADVLTQEALEPLQDLILRAPELMKLLLSLPERLSPLNPLHTAYWTRIVSHLLARNVLDAMEHIYTYEGFVEKLLNHIATSAIADFVMKLLSVEDMPGGRGVSQWLQDNGLVRALVNQIDPFLNPEHHSTATAILLEIISMSYNSALSPEALEGLANGLGGGFDGAAAGGLYQQSLMEQYAATSTLAQLGADRPVEESLLVTELKSAQSIELLVQHMLSADGPYVASTFANATSIIIELIRKYCTEIEQCEFLFHQASQQQAQQLGPDGSPPAITIRPPSEQRLAFLATYLTDILSVLDKQFGAFSRLLTHPRQLPGELALSSGPIHPLGSERLKVCELFAEVLHLQYLIASSPLFDHLLKTPAQVAGAQTNGSATPVNEDSLPALPVAVVQQAPQALVLEKLVDLTGRFVNDEVLPRAIALFFEFEWNNFLHSVVYDMIAKIANTYAFCASSLLPPAPGSAEGQALDDPSSDAARASPQWHMRRLRSTIRALVLDVFQRGALAQRMCEAQRKNDFRTAQPRGTRLGHMGHLTYIADEVLKLFDKCGPGDLAVELAPIFEAEEWVEYVNGPLRETKERDGPPLGGFRPDPNVIGTAAGSFLGEGLGEGLAGSLGEGLGEGLGPDLSFGMSATAVAAVERSSAAAMDLTDDDGLSVVATASHADSSALLNLGVVREPEPIPAASEPDASALDELTESLQARLHVGSPPTAAEEISSAAPTAPFAQPQSRSIEEDQLGRYIVQSVIGNVPASLGGDEEVLAGVDAAGGHPDWLLSSAGFGAGSAPVASSSPEFLPRAVPDAAVAVSDESGDLSGGSDEPELVVNADGGASDSAAFVSSEPVQGEAAEPVEQAGLVEQVEPAHGEKGDKSEADVSDEADTAELSSDTVEEERPSAE